MTENKPLSETLKKRRQLLLVLPLLMLPFVTLAFWALGGGQQEVSTGQEQIAGINAKVPGANNSARPQDKLTLYEDADRRRRSAAADRQAASVLEGGKESLGQFSYPRLDSSANNVGGLSNDLGEHRADDMDVNSLKVEEKLADLQAVIENARIHGAATSGSESIHPGTDGLPAGGLAAAQDGALPGTQNREQLSKLQQLNDVIASAAGSGEGEDGEDADTRQINEMLDKILAIQHPEKAAPPQDASALALSRANKGRIYPVRKTEDAVQVPILLPLINDSGSDKGDSGDSSIAALNVAAPRSYLESSTGRFYDIEQQKGRRIGENEVGAAGPSITGNTLAAVMAETQTLVSGSAVKMRLEMEVVINGTTIPKGNFVFGICAVSGERLLVKIDHIQFQGALFPVHLSVFDLDGMQGVRIPGAISRDAGKEGADRALQSVQMMSLDPSVAAQAATAGIEAAKGLARKKVKLIRVTVKAGYPILLLDPETERSL